MKRKDFVAAVERQKYFTYLKDGNVIPVTFSRHFSDSNNCKVVAVKYARFYVLRQKEQIETKNGIETCANVYWARLSDLKFALDGMVFVPASTFGLLLWDGSFYVEDRLFIKDKQCWEKINSSDLYADGGTDIFIRVTTEPNDMPF